MKRIVSSLPLALLAFTVPAAAQLPPLPTAAPSSPDPQPAPPAATAQPQVLPPLPSQAPVYAPAAPDSGPPSAPPPPYPYPYPPPPPPGPPPMPPEGYRLVPIDPTARTHDGFYFRAGLGGGALSLIGSGPTGSAHAHGPAASVRLAFGGTPFPGLVLGGTIALLGTTSQNGSGVAQPLEAATLVHVAAFADWFPDPHGGWHAGGMLGLASAGLTFGDDANGGSSTAFGGQVFGGYDFWVGEQWSLGLQADFAFATSASLKGNDTTYGGYSLGGVGGGLEVTLLYH